ncbi:MAG: hypothetical protein C4K49_02180 [Candidatus Thorarchaeota archaeon]|nr:MAG: hypothetical protein C4K49_02180 [Candidatus Thorarchaeota archaeon]
MAQAFSSRELSVAEENLNRRLDKLAGVGGLFGAAAAALGLIALLTTDVMPLGIVLLYPKLGASFVAYQQSVLYSTAFFGLLAVGLLLQLRGFRRLGGILESSLPSIAFATCIAALVVLFTIYTGASVNSSSITAVRNYITTLSMVGPIFVILWQLNSVVYVSSSKSNYGLSAGLLNGFFLAVLPLSLTQDGFLVIGVAAAYAILLVGQLMASMYWWAPRKHIKEYARSTDPAKFGFGLSGFLAFLVGAIATFNGPVVLIQGVQVWRPWWTVAIVETPTTWTATWATLPPYVGAFLAAMLFWVMLGPKLGARELRASEISEDIVRGGIKYLSVFLAAFGVIAAGQSGTGLQGSNELAVFLTMCPAAVMLLMGSAYARSTDIVTGIPLVIAAVFMLVGPYVLASVITVSYGLVIITQGTLMVETRVRRFTHFSQMFLTVIFSIAASVLFVLFMLGGFGSGPPAIWPTNRWFNVELLAGIPPAIQGPTIMAAVLACLLVRNVALEGFGYGRAYRGGGVLGGISALFALMIVMISSNETVSHQALTTAALTFALYALSFVMVLSLNLSLGSDILQKGHQVEGQYVRVAAAAGLLAGVFVALYAFYVFSGFPSAQAVAGVITSLMILVVGIEITSILTWVSAGARLGMLTQGFKVRGGLKGES